jgi:hypothetical protein
MTRIVTWDDADFFGTRMTRIVTWDDADFFGTRMTRMTRIVTWDDADCLTAFGRILGNYIQKSQAESVLRKSARNL